MDFFGEQAKRSYLPVGARNVACENDND